MADPKISTFFIALVWIGFFSLVFSYFISNLAANYGQYDSKGNLTDYNKINELRVQAEQFRDQSDISQPSSALDVIGAYISAGYQTLRSTFGSINIFVGMVDTTFDNTTIPLPLAGPFKNAVITTVLIMIILGVAVSALLKYRT